ncbi:MAG: acylphosphatase [Bacillus sp. (in: firmicutes)]
MKTAKMLVSGRVQGVGFRYFTAMEAQKLGIKGWVRNTADGDVEIEATGEAQQLELFIKAVNEGSPFSRVKGVNIDYLDQIKVYHSFKISH